ncbi:hypothetical protein KEM48_008729 [Puccinia striiformis f. sp. tritici PST-130]|nr:hypothetical protein KEM48_008729 [Puccinia striiformis f. sp. tritici PST-130]
MEIVQLRAESESQFHLLHYNLCHLIGRGPRTNYSPGTTTQRTTFMRQSRHEFDSYVGVWYRRWRQQAGIDVEQYLGTVTLARCQQVLPLAIVPRPGLSRVKAELEVALQSFSKLVEQLLFRDTLDPESKDPKIAKTFTLAFQLKTNGGDSLTLSSGHS